ncbi:MAG: class I adenylate-forming enzyme family protein [Solirubrobacterales bacterium]
MAVLRLPAEITERTVRAVLDERAESVGGVTALIATSGATGAETSLAYGELHAAAQRFSAALAGAGVGPGDRVAIMLENDAALEAHVAYHASHRLGAINVPINTRYVQRELLYVLGFSKPSAVVFNSRFAEVLADPELREALGEAALIEVGGDSGLGVPWQEAVDGAGPAKPPAALAEDDDADWIFTSGTTGNPKAVAISHAQSVACGHQAGPPFRLVPGAVFQSFAPFFTSTGCHTNLLGSLVAGCTYVVDPEFHVDGTLERMRRHATTTAFLINPVLQLIFDRRGEEALTEGGFPDLKRLCYGAQVGGRELVDRILEVGRKMGIELVNIYGLTESGNAGLMLVPEDQEEALRRIGQHGMSIGRDPFHPWIEFKVCDAEDREVAPGEPGELRMRQPSTMSRYVDNPEATAAVRRGDWLLTGDVCTVDEEGFVYYVDRDKQIIRRAGLNVSSAEVEMVLLAHPSVAEAAVVPIDDPVVGEDIRAVIVARGDAPDPAEVIAFCAERLADYKVPARVDVVASLPRNAMGRVLKGVLTGRGESLRG